MDLLYRTNFQYNLPLIRAEVLKMLNDHNNPQQIGLMHSESAVTETDKVYESVGAVNVTKHNTQLHPDKRFCIFNKKFVNTELHNMYRDLSKHMNICRLRIMTMGPQFVYPTHKDVLTRYHMAIETNDDCVFYLAVRGWQFIYPQTGIYILLIRETDIHLLTPEKQQEYI